MNDLAFLMRKEKQLPTPALVFIRGEAARYYAPHIGCVEYTSGLVDCVHGLIEVGMDAPELIPGYLCHEFRHHWQFHSGLPVGRSKLAEFEKMEYEDGVRMYFRDWWELDALQFELKHEPNWCGLYMADCLGDEIYRQPRPK